MSNDGVERDPGTAEPVEVPRDTRVSRGWLIAAIAVGGVLVLGLTFGGGLATGLVLSGIHRGGLFVSQVGPGQQWQDGERQWGGEPRQGPDRGTPPQHRDGPDEGDDDTATPTPTPNS